jgi:hypothetical protein
VNLTLDMKKCRPRLSLFFLIAALGKEILAVHIMRTAGQFQK